VSSLHPNLARIAAAYDEICERVARRQITPEEARAEIAQLEARDDEGVRWSLHPDTGTWVRRTAFGDLEFDAAPPAAGYPTMDAFSFTGDVNPAAFDPTTRVTKYAVEDTPVPGGLRGATRLGAHEPQEQSWRDRLPRWAVTLTQVGVVAAAVLAATLAFSALRGLFDQPAEPAPPAPVVVTGQ
jgi:hypothetical protein